jgi:hypothetical protein
MLASHLELRNVTCRADIAEHSLRALCGSITEHCSEPLPGGIFDPLANAIVAWPFEESNASFSPAQKILVHSIGAIFYVSTDTGESRFYMVPGIKLLDFLTYCKTDLSKVEPYTELLHASSEPLDDETIWFLDAFYGIGQSFTRIFPYQTPHDGI